MRPAGFDLASAWRLIAEEVDQRRTPLRVHALVRDDALDLCRWIFGTRARFGATVDDGRIEVELRGHGARSLAGEVAAFGAALEVIDAPAVAEHLARIGTELTRLYGSGLYRSG